MVPANIPEGRTERLILLPLSLADAPQIQRLFPQWEVVKYLANKVPWPYPPDGAEAFLREVALPQVERGEAWHWSLRLLTQPGDLIGAIGLVLSEDDNRGFWLDPAHRGHGYMTEACAWANDFWFDILGQTRLRVPKAVVNHPSRRLSERMGMRVVRLEDRDYVSGRLPSEIWEIAAVEWRDWKADHPLPSAGPSPDNGKHSSALPSRRSRKSSRR